MAFNFKYRNKTFNVAYLIDNQVDNEQSDSYASTADYFPNKGFAEVSINNRWSHNSRILLGK